VKKQKALVVSMERDGRDTTQALMLFSGFSETLLLYEYRREKKLIALQQSSL
jgi:hypothetical protein